ncbi:hypothetical protein DDZ13_09710 [Coraliomargarita sinensis]|uniref:Uncharacterized protein n=1 Tax=Coraliomargarita sinensis TaxID=2174842 RepID=A0A317ZEU4_9BACT|nr:hypothetical protein [Coraliomargarita sinensis]PXA03906.1 hypothetical protein DDZ13_09710 [Coraliomargarita sinensis]
MKSTLPLFVTLACIPIAVLWANEGLPEIISESEAAKIVADEEQAKEAAKDAREAELNSADITRTVKLKQGDKTIVFNLVKPSKQRSTETDAASEDTLTTETAASPERGFFVEPDKVYVNLTLSGEVDTETGISELWWTEGKQDYRIFTNANFLHLGGIGSFEDENSRYSVFSIITRTTSHKEEGKWSPELSDFTEGVLEYLIVEGDENPEAYRGLEAMLRYYAHNKKALRISYENSRKLRKARKAYLEANPPKKRDIILNYSEQ